MCIIIDNDVVGNVLLHNDDDFEPVKNALYKKKNKMVYGGKLREEYLRNEKLRRILIILDGSGSAKLIKEESITSEVDKLENKNLCISNDLHIIALAIVSGARLLCTSDIDLHTDFKNHRLVNNPRGKIYQNSSHVGILEENNRNCRYH